jgi:hypothetical protein
MGGPVAGVDLTCAAMHRGTTANSLQQLVKKGHISSNIAEQVFTIADQENEDLLNVKGVTHAAAALGLSGSNLTHANEIGVATVASALKNSGPSVS